VTVEEVARLAMRLGWDYETLMAMSGAERRLWLAAAERVEASPRLTAPGALGPGPLAPTADGPRLTTEAERRARLLAIHEELNHRGRHVSHD
jgi:hypothetical protein